MTPTETAVFLGILKSDARIRGITWDMIRNMPYRSRATIDARNAMKDYQREGGGWIKYDAFTWGSGGTQAGSKRVSRAVRSLAQQGLVETATSNGRTTSYLRITATGRELAVSLKTEPITESSDASCTAPAD
jgi:hypothetical protein